ncbi:hypothetical protein OF83DRAFT_1123516 [Amylostereum chailletii]|nr:hypothetical protein OF83DRAFT_1123516 [Amylostereum chailletii]
MLSTTQTILRTQLIIQVIAVISPFYPSFRVLFLLSSPYFPPDPFFLFILLVFLTPFSKKISVQGFSAPRSPPTTISKSESRTGSTAEVLDQSL